MSVRPARVRRVRADEGPLLRAVRLRALADTPLAFGSTHAREAAYPPEWWERWARESAAGARQATFLAIAGEAADAGATAGAAEAGDAGATDGAAEAQDADGPADAAAPVDAAQAPDLDDAGTPNPSRPVGLAFAKIADDDPHDAHLYAMWVAPEARGTGAAAALVDAVVAWTTAQGARTLHTNVTTGNEPAARLYARAGFRDTGRREPLGHSGAETAVLERALAP
jgi:ribosomal protein S18 acetylase RimI-like enzyme